MKRRRERDSDRQEDHPPETTRSTSVTTQAVLQLLIVLICATTVSSDPRVIDSDHVLRRDQSPITVREDIEVTENGRLRVESGVELRFAPGTGIRVRGSLVAEGSADQRIIFTKIGDHHASPVTSSNIIPSRSSSSSLSSPFPAPSRTVISESIAGWPDVRLVDGDVPSEGRLQVKVNSVWHSVCTNSKNWTDSDVQLVCKQMGFASGTWYAWFARYNDSRQLMYEQPSCQGNEPDIRSCRGWASRQIGSGVCDYHADIGIRCSKFLMSRGHFWSGIHFHDASSSDEYISSLEGKMKRRVSASVLRFVDILFAGESSTGETVPAVHVIGIPPALEHTTIKWSCGSGLNVTNVADSFTVHNSEISENRGYGIIVNSSFGQVHLNHVTVRDNAADGIRYNLQSDLQTGDDFCKSASLGESQVYPVRITHEQRSDSQSRSRCCQEFRIRNRDNSNAQITAHFPFMMSGVFEGEERDRHRVTDGYVEIVDGYRNQMVSKFTISNETRVQSVTSTNSRLQICYYPAVFKRVLFTIVVVADFGRAYDLNITRSKISGNNGRGVWVQNQRSGLVVNHTVISNHSYIAGLHVDSVGGGDVIVNNSAIVNNFGDGVNISISGQGIKHVDRSLISQNGNRGIAIFYNESREVGSNFLHKNKIFSRVTFSQITMNGGVGFLLGNVCRSDSYVNISMNKFTGNRDDSIEIRTCMEKRQINHSTKILITNNEFVDNHRLALKMSPVARVKNALIAHNVFKLHGRGVIMINNQEVLGDDPFYESLEANIEISDNVMRENSGLFVANIGLQEDSERQSLLFTRNLLEDNSVNQPFRALNPRSRVAAVIAVSSSNTHVIRNNLVNPSSRYEIGVHLEAHSQVINASLNYFGDISSKERTSEIYERIFDRKNRFNLAQVEFLQYRINPYDLFTNELLSIDRERDKFIPFRKGQVLGGEVRGNMMLEEGEYTVVRDIFVRPGSKLVLSRGTQLKFDQSVGMMVQGKLESVGHPLYPIRLLDSGGISETTAPVSHPTPVITHASHDLVSDEEKRGGDHSLPSSGHGVPSLENPNDKSGNPVDPTDSLSSSTGNASPAFESGNIAVIINDNRNNNFTSTAEQRTGNSFTHESLPLSWETGDRRRNRFTRSVSGEPVVRLSRGTSGRLEVRMGNEFGAVCSYGFDIVDAALACQQMGLVLNSRDWLLEKSQYNETDGPASRIIVTNLQCTIGDTDITQCKSEKEDDFLNSCASDVGIRCYRPSWSGVRLGMIAEQAHIENTEIENAGHFDYATYSFTPALVVDFHRHRLQNLTVRGNQDSGVGFNWNDLFTSDRPSLRLLNSRIDGNKNHGILTKSQGLQVSNCQMAGNEGSGVHYDAMFTRKQQKDLISWVVPQDADQAVIPLPAHSIPAPSSPFAMRTASTSRTSSPPTRHDFGRFLHHGSHDEDDDELQPVFLNGREIMLDPRERSFWYIRVAKHPPANFSDWFVLTTKVEHGLGIMILNPMFGDATDQFKIRNDALSVEWDLRRNLSSFPMLNYGFKLTVSYSAGEKPRGNILIYVAVKRIPNLYESSLASNEVQENRDIKTMTLENCVFRSNGRGIATNHYNRDIGDDDQYFHRHSNETIILSRSRIDQSRREAVFVSSPFYDPLEVSLAEINFTIIDSQITNNAKGIVQYSRDIRNSNNLFHWIINRTEINENTGPVLLIRLPYVWQYNENFTHSIRIHDNSFHRNKNFDFKIDGHFARFNMSGNSFRDNFCENGLITISGMEKEMRIMDNVIEGNYGHFMLEFRMQSHADKFALVPAFFTGNSVVRNMDTVPVRPLVDLYQPHSYTLALRGVQLINITRNSFSNENLQFELLAAMLTGSLETKVNVEENWWGSANHTVIRSRIFDFDDWNSFAIADFSPFLASSQLDSVTIPAGGLNNFVDVTRPFGGRLHRSLRLDHRQGMPYKVSSDLTVMPGATLTLGPGVEIEFFPSVGILVLGDMIAAGTDARPVVFRPQRMTDDVYRFKREQSMPDVTRDQDASDLSEVRLCMTESCREWDRERKSRDGFLEVYNRTTLQWMSVCDPRFTERNAQVVCRQMGFSVLNVHVRRGKRMDVGPTLISRVRYWPEPLECSGRESSIAACDVRLNGYGNHTHACAHDGQAFIYINCGSEVLGHEQQYWGGIRFATATFEHRGSRIHTSRNRYDGAASKLQHVSIIGAGVLHGEKNAALQMINRDVNLEFVNVSYSAHHGVEAIAPSTHLRYHRIRVEKNLGSGLNYLLLGGASTPHQPLPYVPMTDSTIPYNVYGLVDICDLNKNMVIEERILLYYKYDSRPVDCVKIFRTKYENKPIGFRIIQFNLFNSTDYAAVPDSLKLYNGDISNATSKLIGDLGVTEEHRINKSERLFYASSLDGWNTGVLSVRLHASGASQAFGFIAEVIAIPGSYFVARDFDHNITYSEISNNMGGGVTYKSAGEASPSLNVLFNKFEMNCERLYENFTTCDAALNFQLQNTQSFVFNNNLLKLNQGGLRLETNSQTAAASLSAVLTNNLFDSNLNNEALFAKGRETGSYQIIEVSKNYFTHNSAAYKSTIVLEKVITNFTKNIVVTNAGKHQLEVIGFKRRPISYQTIRGNWFYNNFASHLNEKSTIFASNAGQEYRDNYFVNPDNDFEFATLNRTHIINMRSKSREEREKERELDRKLFISASNNWWGFNETSAITSRILDSNDYPDLLRVNFIPFHTTNRSVLSGICSGGWESVGHTCFTYIGSRMSFQEARRFCESQNSTMPFIRGNQRDLTRFLTDQQYGYDHRFFHVWVQSFDYDVHECTTLIDFQVLRHDCDDELPFFCEKDPDIRVLIGFWYKEPLGIAAVVVSAATAILSFCCVCCWLCKSREKAKEKLQRRNSIRASIRSNRTMTSASLASSMNDIAYKRHQIQGGSMTLNPMGMNYPGAMSPPIQLSVMNMNGTTYGQTRHKTPSIESFAESGSVRLHPDPHNHHHSHSHLSDSLPSDRRQQLPQSFRPLEDRFIDPGLENANIDLMVRPTFDLTFENRAFKTETPSASRASDVVFEYSDGRSWTPNLMSAAPLATSRQPVNSQRPVLPKRQLPPPSPSSIGQFSRRTPSPSQPHFNNYEATSTLRTYERLPQQDMMTFAPVRMSKSHGSLMDDRTDVRSDVTAATNVTTRTKQSQYLETSLDGESVQDNNYDYCDYGYQDDVVSMSTVSVSSKSRPLETSM